MYSNLDISRLLSFLQDKYKKIESKSHRGIDRQVIEAMIKHCVTNGYISKEDKILDINCCLGEELEIFLENGFDNLLGVAFNRGDWDACNKKGLRVVEMEQPFFDFNDSSFDFIWARHVAEYSLIPFFTISEYYRVLNSGGRAYVEVYSGEKDAKHEKNVNFYSVFEPYSWFEIFKRTGFEIIDMQNIVVGSSTGKDTYHTFVLRK